MSVRELLSEGSLEYMKEQEEEALDQLASIRIANLTAKALQAFDEQEANTIFARISQGDAYMEWDHDGGWLTYWAGPEILFICSIASLYDPQIHPQWRARAPSALSGTALVPTHPPSWLVRVAVGSATFWWGGLTHNGKHTDGALGCAVLVTPSAKSAR